VVSFAYILKDRCAAGLGKMAPRDQISLRQLRYFLAVCEQGTVSGAARALNVSQPAVGMQIKLLEDVFGTTLLRRSAQGAVPTEAGRVLQKHSKRVIKNLSQAHKELAELRGSGEIRLTLGITTTSGKELVGPMLAAIKSRPSLKKFQLTFREGKSDDLLDLLRERKIDAALSYEDSGEHRFHVTVLYSEQFVLVGTPKALKGRSGTVALDEIGEFPLVMSPAEEGGRRFIEEAAMRRHARLNVDTEISSALLKQEMLFQHRKCMIVPRARFAAEIRTGKLSMLQLSPPLSRTKLFVLRSMPRTTHEILRSLVKKSVEQRMIASETGWLPAGSGP